MQEGLVKKETGSSAVSMRDTDHQIPEEMKKLKDMGEGQPEYVEKLMACIEDIVSRIERYDRLLEQLSGLEQQSGNKAFVPLYYGMPVSYEAMLRTGGQVHNIPVDRSVRKSNPGIMGFAAALGLKRKSKPDLVKAIANKELSPEQLVQIRVAMQKGLTESQLMELVNNRMDVDQMKEIIEIAVLENAAQE
ncbi:hypothetical protein [Anaerobium acetethylicum]|uniref:Uncharacterized protein n=1 Tax=Anaerobium acetethylicum TaxID=1619234 RepID=A0A1D3TUK2_9FIRM|nr:hypothetical protein [Anaerobium acetethylicum]SCP97749.1 hypothetical protein SAMN05421730_101353 [Anaerobium acetethylicum]